MDVLEAIKSRKSIRAFTDQSVPRKTIQKILEISQRAPSGTNTQPWHVYICAGAVREASARQGTRNFKFFDAPVGLFITVDAYLARGNWADAGMYAQTIMLAARSFGLHTCPQAAWIQFQGPIFSHLGIPNDQVLVTGMCLGYADDSAVENTLVSNREDVANVAHFVGF